eukprot:scaffold3866_cov61-Phaeocystis_antarctica.AAC.2
MKPPHNNVLRKCVAAEKALRGSPRGLCGSGEQDQEGKRVMSIAARTSGRERWCGWEMRIDRYLD